MLSFDVYFLPFHWGNIPAHDLQLTFLSFPLTSGRSSRQVSMRSKGQRLEVPNCILPFPRGTQRQFSENICSEYDLRSRIFRNICCKTVCLPASPRIFEHLNTTILAHFNGFLPLKGHLEFSGAFYLAEILEKVIFDPYNFRINRLSVRKFEHMKNF